MLCSCVLPVNDRDVVVRILNSTTYQVCRSVQLEEKYRENLASSAGLEYQHHDTRKQQDALVAAKTAKALLDGEVFQGKEFTRIIECIYLAMGVSQSTFYVNFKLVKEKTDPAIRDQDLHGKKSVSSKGDGSSNSS